MKPMWAARADLAMPALLGSASRAAARLAALPATT
jgi:hypothetical protein